MNRRVLLITILLGALMSAAAGQTRAMDEKAADDWFKQYYQKPDPSQLPGFLTALASRGILQRPQVAPLLAGFMSQLFREHESLIPVWISVFDELPSRARQPVYYALAISGSPAGASYIKRTAGDSLSGVDSMAASLRAAADADLLSRQGDSVEALDLLWGAFFATGNIEHIKHIASALAWKTEPSLAKKRVAVAAEWSLTANARDWPEILGACEKIRSSADPSTRDALTKVIDAAKSPRRTK